MTAPSFIIFGMGILIGGGLALKSQITIYELPDLAGDSITLRGKYPSLSNWTFFLSKTKSYCSTGW